MDLKHKYDIKTIPYSKSLDNRLRKINNNENLKNIIQKINIRNKNLVRYNQIENLLKPKIKHKEEKDKDLISLKKKFKKENSALIALERNKTYEEDIIENSNKTNSEKALNIEKSLKERKMTKINNISQKFYEKEGLYDYFKKMNNKERKNGVKLFPLNKSNDFKNRLFKVNINDSKKLFTEPNNTNNGNKTNNSSEKEKGTIIKEYNQSFNKQKQYQKNYYLPKTLEADKRINIGFDKYATNNVIFNNPQFYLLNNRNTSFRQKLPYINTMKKGNIKPVDLFKKNNKSFISLSNGNNNNDEKYKDFYLKLRKNDIIKFKIE